MNSKVGFKDYFGYAMGDFGCNMSFALITNYVALFYTQYIGVSLKDWAWIIIVCNIWDAVNDPMVGGIVDRCRISKKSKFAPWILIGGISLVFCTAICFLPLTNISYTGKVIYCLLSYCIWSMAYTVANVPYGAMHSAITAESDKRTNLSTFRSIGAGLATGPLMLLPLLVFDENDNIRGDKMIWVALGCSLIGLVGFILVYTLVTERVETNQVNQKFNFLKVVKSFLTNRPLVAISLASAISIICFMSMSHVNSVIFQSYFHNTDMIAVTNIIGYLPMVLIMPFVGKITRKLSKKGFVVLVNAISTVAGLIMILVPMPPDKTSSIVIWIIGIMFLYLSNASLNVVVWAMVVDCIDYGYRATGVKEEASTYALYSFFRKLASGAGSALSALLIAACGYVEAKGADQTFEVALKIKNMYFYVMTVGVAISYLLMKFMYNIDERKLEN